MDNMLLREVEYKYEETRLGTWRSYLYPTGMLFREFQSHRRVYGFPLIHYTRGICPETGRHVIARGVIAVGRLAVGGIAIGHASLGVVAFGQAALGLAFGFGQLATGAFAIGQAAIGLVFGFGQFATGLTAIGQFAIGKSALGQVVVKLF